MLCRDDWAVDTAKSVLVYRSMHGLSEQMALTALNSEGHVEPGSR